MSFDTTEALADRIFECGLIESRELAEIQAELGTRYGDLSVFRAEILRRGTLTNWQLRRVDEGFRTGFFFGKWKVLYLVGAGTFARVYRAVHSETQVVRALKVLRQRYVDDKTTTEQFVREGRTVMRFKSENIIKIYEVESDKERTYMVMDLIEGQNLRDYVKAHGKLPMDRAVSISLDLANGLDYAFKRGITHRDLKLSNVLLSSKGRAILVDFGLAGSDKNVTGESEDTVNPRSIDYAALERITKVRRNDKRSDVFFLGCMIYQLVCGKPALAETRERMQRLSAARFQSIEPITNLVSEIPSRLVVLLNKTLELNPKKRLQTPGEVASALEAILQTVKDGTADIYNPETAKKEKEAYEKNADKANEGRGQKVMVIESKTKLQDIFREKLKEVGYRPLIFGDPRLALSRFEYLDPAEDAPAECVIFSCADLSADGLSAFNFFAEAEQTSDFPAILLVTDKQQHFIKQAKLNENRLVIQLPLKFKELRLALLKLTRETESA